MRNTRQVAVVILSLIGLCLAQAPHQSTAKRCFYEGQWHHAGTLINAGRSHNWCFGTYCDKNAQVHYWDDFNCPVAQTTPPSVNQHIRQPSGHVRQPHPITTPPTPRRPTTTQSLFDSMGCFHRGRFYWRGQDIWNGRKGFRCTGVYCDWNGKVQTWEDSCRYTMPPPPATTPDLT